MQERTLDGIWWTPGAEDAAVGGRLTFSRADGVRLETIGALTRENETSLDTTRLPLIYGTVASLQTGNDVTLYDATRDSTSSMGRHVKQEFGASSAILGAHASTREISRVEVALTQLPQWLVESGFDLEFGEREDFEYRVTHRKLVIPEVATPYFQMKIGLRSLPPVTSHRLFPLREEVFLEILPKVPMTFDELHEKYLWRLQNFLTFATEKASAISWLWGWLPAKEHGVEILFRHPFESEATSHPVEMLFTYRDVSDRLSNLLSKWFELYDVLGPSLNQIFAAIYGEYRHTDTKFLNVIQAAESYHRRVNPVSPDVIAAHRARVKRVAEAMDLKDRSWVKGKLKHAYEPALAERLFELFTQFGDDFTRPMFATPGELRRSVDEMAEWRNKLTHLTATPEEIDSALFDLHVFTNQLLTALKASVLLALGFTAADLESCFRYNQMYRHFARRRPLETAQSNSA